MKRYRELDLIRLVLFDELMGFANPSCRETIPRVRKDKTSVPKHLKASFDELLSFPAVSTLHGLVSLSSHGRSSWSCLSGSAFITSRIPANGRLVLSPLNPVFSP